MRLGGGQNNELPAPVCVLAMCLPLSGGMMISLSLYRRLSRGSLLAAALVLLSGVVFVPEARAGFSVDVTSADVNRTFQLDWNYASNTSSGGGLTAPLSSVGTFTIDSFSSSDLVMSATIDNTTTLTSGLTQSYLMSIGIATAPITSGTMLAGGSVFNSVTTGSGPQETYPGGFKAINVCLFNAAGGCSGASINDGLAAGSTDSFTVALAGNFGSSPSVTLSDFAVKFQTNEGSYEFGDGGSFLSETPEPPTALLFATALLVAVGLVRRRLLSPGGAHKG